MEACGFLWNACGACGNCDEISSLLRATNVYGGGPSYTGSISPDTTASNTQTILQFQCRLHHSTITFVAPHLARQVALLQVDALPMSPKGC